MVVVAVRDLLQLRDVKKSRESIKMKHGVVFAVFAKERHVFAEVHIPQTIGDKTAVTSLYPLAELL